MNMVDAQSIAQTGLLSTETIRETLVKGLANKFAGQKILVLIPDTTRSVPLPFLFRALVEVLGEARRLDFMVALGTPPPLSEASLLRLVGITPGEHLTAFKHVGLLNHAWT
jgi:nickel-dependent lactate racemase